MIQNHIEGLGNFPLFQSYEGKNRGNGWFDDVMGLIDCIKWEFVYEMLV